MVVTVFLLDKDRVIQAVLNNKISWSYDKAINKATNIKVSIPREDFASTSKSNLTAVAQYVQVYCDGVYTVGGRVTKRDITDATVDLTAFTEEIQMESVICPPDYSRKYDEWDIADIARDLDRGWATTRIKSTSQWESCVDSSNIDFESLANRVLLTKDASGVYNSDGYITFRFLASDIEGFTTWDRIRWVSDNYGQTSEGEIELVSTTVQYRHGATVGTLGAWSEPVIGASPDKLGLDIAQLESPVLEVRMNLHTDDSTSEGPEGEPIGSSPVVFALEVIARKAVYIGTSNVPESTGVYATGLVADGDSAFSILCSLCEITGWEFEVYNNDIYLVEELGRDLTETFVFKKDENIKITQLSDGDDDLVNVLHANGKGSGINRLSLTLTDPESIALYGEYPETVDFDTEDLTDLTSQAEEYLANHSSVLMDWKVETFDSIDSTLPLLVPSDELRIYGSEDGSGLALYGAEVNGIYYVYGSGTVEESLAFHSLFSTSTFSAPSSLNLVEQNLMFYKPSFRVGDIIRIVDPMRGSIIDSRIMEEKRTGDSTGIKVTLYLNKGRDVLVTRVNKPVEVQLLERPISISIKPEIGGALVTIPAPNDRIRWSATELYISETTPVPTDTPFMSSRDTSFRVNNLDNSRRYYFVARYVDINQQYSKFSREVSCIPAILDTGSQITLFKRPENIVFTARGGIEVAEVTVYAELHGTSGEITWSCEGGTVQEMEIEEGVFDNRTVVLDGLSMTGDHGVVTATISAGGRTHQAQMTVDKLIIGNNTPEYIGAVDDEIPLTMQDEPLIPGDYFLWVGPYIGDHPEHDPNNEESTEEELKAARDIKAPLSESGEYIPGRIYAWNGTQWAESRNSAHITSAHVDVIAIARATGLWFYAAVVIAEQAEFENLVVTDGDFKVSILKDGHKNADGKGVPSFEISISEPSSEDPDHRKMLMQVNAEKKVLDINTDGIFSGTIESPALTTTKGSPAETKNYNNPAPVAYPVSTLYDNVSLVTDGTIETVSNSTYKKPIAKAGRLSTAGTMLTLGSWSVDKGQQGGDWTHYATTTVPAGCNYINVTLTIYNDFGGTGGCNIEIWRGGSRIVNQTYSGSKSSTKSAYYTYNVQPGDTIKAFVKGYLLWGTTHGYVDVTYRARASEKSLFFLYTDGTSEYVPYVGYTSTPAVVKDYSTTHTLYTAGTLRGLMNNDYSLNTWIPCLSGSSYTTKTVGGSSVTTSIIAMRVTSSTVEFTHNDSTVVSLAVWSGAYKGTHGLFESLGATIVSEAVPRTVSVATVLPKEGATIGKDDDKFQFGYFNSLYVDNFNLLPTGMIVAFPVNATPTGWLKCEGAAISRTVYSYLFAAIGTTYGAGDGSTTFNLPDFRGRFLRGYGGNSRGIGLAQADEIKSHTHSLKYVYGSASGSVGLAIEGGNKFDDANIGPFGGVETRPLNYAVYWMIKY